MANRKIRIKESVLQDMDHASTGTTKAGDIYKTFQYDGETFVITGTGEKSVPDYIATAWIAADADLEIITNPAY
jgi:hypothetical protein